MHQSLQCAHDKEYSNQSHHSLTKAIALEVSHSLMSPLKALASSNIPPYEIYKITKYVSVIE
jgi:hypothetical protein